MKNKTLKRQLVAQFYHRNIPFLCIAVFGTLVSGSLNLILSWIVQQLIDTASGGLNALPSILLHGSAAALCCCALRLFCWTTSHSRVL